MNLTNTSITIAALLGIAVGILLWSQNERFNLGNNTNTVDPATILEPIEPETVRIPAGSFLMGAVPGDKQAFENEKPRHKVTIHNDFEMGKYEVSFREYDVFARLTNRRLPGDNGWGRGKRPVINVSWYDAAAYAQWLSEQTGKTYRLPTEAEWEYATRAGTESVFWWGESIQPNKAQCRTCLIVPHQSKTLKVGSLDANPFGLYDTAGNVTEWIRDCYINDYLAAPLDGSAYIAKPCEQRVIRGGSWYNEAITVRSSHRSGLRATKDDNNGGGFRLVKELP